MPVRDSVGIGHHQNLSLAFEWRFGRHKADFFECELVVDLLDGYF